AIPAARELVLDRDVRAGRDRAPVRERDASGVVVDRIVGALAAAHAFAVEGHDLAPGHDRARTVDPRERIRALVPLGPEELGARVFAGGARGGQPYRRRTRAPAGVHALQVAANPPELAL